MKLSTVVKNGKRMTRVAWVDGEGKERRRFFGNQAKAKAFAGTISNPPPDYAQWLALDPERRSDAIAAIKAADGAGVSLLDAVTYYLSNEAAVSKKGLKDAWREFQTIKEHHQKVRASTKHNMHTQIGRYVKHAGNKTLNTITDRDLIAWMDAHQWAPSSRNSFLTWMRAFLRWCKSRGYVARVVTDSIPKARTNEAQVGILTVSQSRDLMRATQKHDPELIPYVALGMFAGIRPNEITRLKWSQIDLKAARINLTGSATKTRRNRWVTIAPNLKEWLKLGGDLPPANLRNRFDIVRAEAGLVKRTRDRQHKTWKIERIHWPSDAMRHTYASHKIALFGYAQTAIESGNSEQVLIKHYRQPVTKAEARRYFAIRPK